MSLYCKAFCSHECYNQAMRSAMKRQQKQGGYEGFNVSDPLAALAGKDQLLEDKNRVLEEKDQLLQVHQKHLSDKNHIILEQGKRISLLEEDRVRPKLPWLVAVSCINKTQKPIRLYTEALLCASLLWVWLRL